MKKQKALKKIEEKESKLMGHWMVKVEYKKDTYAPSLTGETEDKLLGEEGDIEEMELDTAKNHVTADNVKVIEFIDKSPSSDDENLSSQLGW